MKSVRRFDGKVTDYDRYRERYAPDVLLPILRQHCGLVPEWLIADVGAGTGMLADVFLSNGNPVVAVEPNAEMRDTCTELHRGMTLTIVDGIAEQTGLPDHSVDLVTAGRAMHWFDPERSMAEFRRILKSDGWIAIIALGRTEKGREENILLEQLLRQFSPEHADTHAGYSIYRSLETYLTRDLYRREILSSMKLDWEALHGMVMSLSHAPSREADNYAAFETALRSLYEGYASNGSFVLESRYWINIGRLPR
ncbi:MAG: class I SAM-dependent methyltransferase [Edaphobacter sp.]|uniref:class I SAM-dependent methyltransferase n=1 Tax=Edaphobacter sp. TaxID=1934404 RepID=UPI00238F1FD3|nr:class I SAM-dependent methyltransferase [Edaphobacter sp.]MDE1177775.1 class I SAM-dependent methyltransferase [Edaphobacter sp.]